MHRIFRLRAARYFLAAGLLAVLSACGGGGGGGNSISISPTSLSFAGSQSSPAPAQAVDVSFNGDGVLVGYAPGVPQADWLYVEQGTTSAGRVRFWFSVNPYQAAGTYQTSIRFVTGNYDGTGVKYRDMRITYRVTDLAVSPNELSFAAVDGSTAQPTPATRSFNVAATGVNWTATSSQPWLVLGRTSGSGSGTVSFTLNAAALAIGTHTANISVRNPATNDVAVLAVTLDKRAPRLVVVPDPVAFAIGAQSGAESLSLTATVTDELDGADASRAVDWTLAAPAAEWLQAAALSGNTVAGNTLELSLPTEALAGMPNGTYQTMLEFSYVSADDTQGDLFVPVTLTLNLPRVSRVAPFVAVAGASDKLILRGEALAGVTGQQVRFGGQSSTAVEVVSATELRVTPPALPEGTYPVWVDGPLGEALATASLAVVAPQTLTAATLPAAYFKRKIFYDASRSTLYVIDADGDKLERFQHTAGGWGALAPLAIAGLNDFSPTPDGRKLIVVTNSTVASVDLSVEPLAAQTLHTITDTFCGRRFGLVNVTNNNEAIVYVQLGSCSGYTDYFGLNLDTLVKRPLDSVYNATMALSADGGRLVVGGNGLSPPPSVSYFSASTGTVKHVAVNDNVYAINVNRDAARTLLQETRLYDSAFSLLGQFPACSGSCGGAALSPDGTRAYRLRVASPTQRYVDILDVGTPPAAGQAYPVLDSIAVSGNPTGNDYAFWIQGQVSPDGRTLFLAGQGAIVVVPLPAP